MRLKTILISLLLFASATSFISAMAAGIPNPKREFRGAWLHVIGQSQFSEITVYLATDGIKETYICVDSELKDSTVNYFMEYPDVKFICIERVLDSIKKFNLKNKMKTNFFAF